MRIISRISCTTIVIGWIAASILDEFIKGLELFRLPDREQLSTAVPEMCTHRVANRLTHRSKFHFKYLDYSC